MISCVLAYLVLLVDKRWRISPGEILEFLCWVSDWTRSFCESSSLTGTESCDVEVDVVEVSGYVSLACTLTKGTGEWVIDEGESEISKELRRWEKEDNVILFRLIFLVDTEDGGGEELAMRGLIILTIAYIGCFLYPVLSTKFLPKKLINLLNCELDKIGLFKT